MRFPLYWKTVTNESGTLSARGWSDVSEAEAQIAAQKRFDRILHWIRNRGVEPDFNRYRYVIDDCICEFVVDRVEDPTGNEIGVISRNVYGALVLNAANVMIIDIDVVPVSSAKRAIGLLAKWFGAKSKKDDTLESRAMEKIRDWHSKHADVSFRVYRTCAGLRAIVINQVFHEISPSTIAMMEQLESDPLYRELCKSQKCFRARLTPKPWRIGKSLPQQKFPFDSDEQEAAFQEWFDDYIARSEQWSVCRYLETIGSPDYHPTALKIVELHDQFCCSDDHKQLA